MIIQSKREEKVDLSGDSHIRGDSSTRLVLTLTSRTFNRALALPETPRPPFHTIRTKEQLGEGETLDAGAITEAIHTQRKPDTTQSLMDMIQNKLAVKTKDSRKTDPAEDQGRDPFKGNVSSDCTVGGRLHRFQHKWSQASRWARNVVGKGLTWKWTNQPPKTGMPTLSRSEGDVGILIKEFVKEGVVEEVKPQECYLSKIFTVPKPSGQQRLILNLKSMNNHINTHTFRMSNHTSLKKLLPQGAWMCALRRFSP